MLKTKSILTNFLKTLVIASMTIASVSAFAGDHEKGEKKIGDLKDMKAKTAEMQAEDLANQLDVEATEGAMKDKAKEMMEDKAGELTEKVMEAAPQ